MPVASQWVGNTSWLMFVLAGASGLSPPAGIQGAVPMHTSPVTLPCHSSLAVLQCPELTPGKASWGLQVVSTEGSTARDRAQPRVRVHQISRTLLLVSPRQVWDVQHSRTAAVHVEKWQSGRGCTQCSLVPPFRGEGPAGQTGD